MSRLQPPVTLSPELWVSEGCALDAGKASLLTESNTSWPRWSLAQSIRPTTPKTRPLAAHKEPLPVGTVHPRAILLRVKRRIPSKDTAVSLSPTAGLHSSTDKLRRDLLRATPPAASPVSTRLKGATRRKVATHRKEATRRKGVTTSLLRRRVTRRLRSDVCLGSPTSDLESGARDFWGGFLTLVSPFAIS